MSTNVCNLFALAIVCFLNGCTTIPIPFFFNSDSYSEKPYIFLVAGGDDSANYVEEIIQQRDYFISKGVPPKKIRCYYVPPSDSALKQDFSQYQRNSPKLAPCYYADLDKIGAHLLAASKAPHPYLYIYISSHGLPPSGIDPSLNHLDSFGLLLKTSPTRFLLDPVWLVNILNSWPKKTRKYVVLQGCHSGGFIRAPKKYSRFLLKTVPNIAAFAAARHDRASFGCGPGGSTTYFGGVYLQTLAASKKTPDKIRWEQLASKVKKGITSMETQAGVSNPSLPVFYTNIIESAR